MVISDNQLVANETSQSKTTGKILLWGGVLAVLFNSLLAAITSGLDAISTHLVGVFLVSELLWGSKWSRWITGLYILILSLLGVLSAINIIVSGFEITTPVIFYGAAIFYAVMGVTGIGLMINQQVVKQLADLNTLSIKKQRLKVAVRLILFFSIILIAIFDFVNTSIF